MAYASNEWFTQRRFESSIINEWAHLGLASCKSEARPVDLRAVAFKTNQKRILYERDSLMVRQVGTRFWLFRVIFTHLLRLYVSKCVQVLVADGQDRRSRLSKMRPEDTEHIL